MVQFYFYPFVSFIVFCIKQTPSAIKLSDLVLQKRKIIISTCVATGLFIGPISFVRAEEGSLQDQVKILKLKQDNGQRVILQVRNYTTLLSSFL